jgi:hypothetical protein
MIPPAFGVVSSHLERRRESLLRFGPCEAADVAAEQFRTYLVSRAMFIGGPLDRTLKHDDRQ